MKTCFCYSSFRIEQNPLLSLLTLFLPPGPYIHVIREQHFTQALEKKEIPQFTILHQAGSPQLHI